MSGYLDGLKAARNAVIAADAYADAIGSFNGQLLVTAETKRHIEAIDQLIVFASASQTPDPADGGQS